jgi:translocation and assembly module TamA
MFGAGELVRAEVAATKIEQSVDLSALKPLPRFPGSVFGGLSFRNETTDAYDARTFGADVGLSRLWFDERLDLRGGLAIETSNVETKSDTTTLRDGVFYYVSLPLSATWDSESDPLRLEDGLKASLQLTPYAGTDAFTRIEATARSRIRFGEGDRFTIAGRTRFAATIGSALASLPVNKRVYSGGGSSVRGYGYQAVGPIDTDGVPLGGRSAIEAALEARARVAGPFEIAGFIDAGAVTNQNFPKVDGDYLAGAGGGLRYHSPIGPIRADVAFPLEKRAGDADFQLYISIGQPF